jgi:hypothetical protein
MSDTTLEVDLDELEALSQTLLRHLRTVAGNRVVLAKDFYWNVPESDRYDVYQEPTSFTIGQLSDSWAKLRALDETNTVTFALVWLGDILRAIGEDVVE